MKTANRSSRRSFLATAIAAGACASSLGQPRTAKSQSPGDRLNVGLVGVGIRGYDLQKGIQESQHAQLGAIADISDHYIERIRPRLSDPNIPVHRDYRRLLDDQTIDAVVIATPDHWHAQMTLEALDAGKDVYVEKPMTYSLDEAIRVRDRARQGKRVVQVGYQRRTLEHYEKARTIVQSGILGDITQIQLWSSRNRPVAPWRAYDTYNTPGLPEKSGPEHVDWDRFQANRPPRPYDARRFFHWQCYEEYSTGIFGILMSHPLDAANLVMGLGVPATCAATGGIFVYDDDRTVPDTCNAIFHYSVPNLLISFVGSSNNSFFNREAQYRGTHGTMELGPNWLRLYAEEKNQLFAQYVSPDKADQFTDLSLQPIHREPVHYTWSTIEHLDDFFENVKRRGQCRATVEDCFPATVAMAMAIESSRSQRTIHWDAEREQFAM